MALDSDSVYIFKFDSKFHELNYLRQDKQFKINYSILNVPLAAMHVFGYLKFCNVSMTYRIM